MLSARTRFTAFYGSGPAHLLATIAAWALAAYVVVVLGVHTLWNPRVWWQSIGVWFVGAVIAHDVILFPLYTLAERCLATVARRSAAAARLPAIAPLNYLRVPTLASALSLLLFFPGILDQGKAAYVAATGRDQQPFLGRWLLLVAGVYGLSAIVYALRLAVVRRRGR